MAISESFSSPDPIQELARDRFGISALSPWQRFAIANTLENLNQLVTLPTGGGKSVCFLLPALLLPRVTIVILPLLSLLKDQERRLHELGISCAVLQGGQSGEIRRRLFAGLQSRTMRIVLTVPEMLTQTKAVQQLRDAGVSHVVIDEAHCVSEWGTSFRPAYLKLGDAVRALGEPLVSAYTATASPEVVRDIDTLLFQDRVWSCVSETPDRPNIFYRVMPTLSKSRQLVSLVSEAARPLVVFCRSRTGVEMSARLLRRRLSTDEVFFYHAGLTREERLQVEEWFFKTKAGILCSTSAYGMGIDKSDIRTIIHNGIPLSVEAYMQESGRAGRDGKPARAILIYSGEDAVFGQGLHVPEQRVRFARIYAYADGQKTCRRRYLLDALGGDPVDCSGCDICEGIPVTQAEGQSVILDVIRKAPRRYGKRELMTLLAGRNTYEAVRRGLADRCGFGSLRTWEWEELEEGVEDLEVRGLICAPEKGLFKYRYSLHKNRENP